MGHGSAGTGTRFLRAVAVWVTAAVLVSGCEGLEEGDSSTGAGPTSPDGRAVSPLKNPAGTKPGLAPVTADADEETARKLIEELSTKGRGPKTGYARDEFGYAWMDTADGVPLARNGCDTRNDLIERDGQDLRFRSGSDCVVVAMTLHDPYTGRTIEWRKQAASEVQIDHVVPLSYSWQMGSSRWPESKRKQFANDVLNLIPVEGRANSAKGDSGPASWLPPNKPIRCAYVVRFAQVALKYEMPVTAPDKQMMLKQCGG
ncbi:HNH endonuclease family protein [Streptomyces europaeiscabiei]|uniref:HNH endonuclease family protein n=1 Tax=Streptomyces TaxID=1883 RepID=UPI000A3BB09E|nr:MULTISPECIES: HNH endonuclease family protein [Streptomyces]MDX3634468.1 HNH endonuclease family protein [Streptomyces europaeiscabiei]MDX3653376.1 HNH endonuclease family protein [Streptomyces europaeiscabiei]WUD33219.1 HNH endonuclease family protein [Streptomyces europaeiscabiei]